MKYTWDSVIIDPTSDKAKNAIGKEVYYANNPVLSGDDEAVMKARLALLRAVGVVIANGLSLLGVSAPESM